MSMINKEDLKKLSLILDEYISPEKSKRERSENQLKEIREKNFDILLLSLLELSVSPDFSETNKITSLVLLRKIIELDGKIKWGNISNEQKEKIKHKSLEIIFNNSNLNHSFINKVVSIIEELVKLVGDFNEDWSELKELMKNIFSLHFPEDLNKIYAIIKILKVCMLFLSNDLISNVNQFNNFYSTIFNVQLNTINNIKDLENILELKILICSFYSDLLTYSTADFNINSQNNYIAINIINTLKECLSILNNNNENFDIENYTSELLTSIDVLTAPGFFVEIHEYQIQICQLLTAIIDLKKNYQKLKEQCFQKLLDIYFLNYTADESLEMTLKNFLDKLFLYGFQNLNENFENSNEEFSKISVFYSSYDKVPKIFYDVLNFIFGLTSQIIQENESYIKIIKELSLSLIQNNNIIYKYVGLMLFPQVIEACNDFNLIESSINLIMNEINNSNNQIRYAATYCLSFYVFNYKNKFIEKYSETFLITIVNSIKKENCIHTKCEMLSLFNAYISQLEDLNDETGNNNITSVKSYLNKNIKDLFEFLFNLFEEAKNKDSEYSLFKNEILKSINYCISFYGDKCQEFAIKYIDYLAKYLDFIYTQKINQNLFIGILYVISSFGKYKEDYIEKILNSLFKCLEEVLTSIKDKSPNVSDIQNTLENLLPIIINKKPELIALFMKDILELIEYTINQDNNETEKNKNYVEDLNSVLKTLNSSIEILEENSLKYVNQIEKIIEKLHQKYKNENNIHIQISNILVNIINIMSENNSENLKNKGKYYLEITMNMLNNEYVTDTSIILSDNFNKILENIVKYMDKNELESMANGAIKLMELFEGKRLTIVRKRNKKENEQEEKNEKEESLSSDLDDDDNNYIENLGKHINKFEQILENISLIFENILKYGNKNYLSSIYQGIYNEVIPNLMASIEKTPLLQKYQNNLKIVANLVDDILEYVDYNNFIQNPDSLEKLLNILYKLSLHEKASIRQATCYGLGIFIKNSDNNLYQKYSKNIFENLKKSLNEFYPQNKEISDRAEGLAYDNIIAAFGKAIGYKKLNDVSVINLWIEKLPLNYDETEMEEGHDILCDYILSGRYKNDNIDEFHLCKVLMALISVYKEKDLTNKDIDDKIKNIISAKTEFRPMIEKIYAKYKELAQNNDKNAERYKKKVEELIK